MKSHKTLTSPESEKIVETAWLFDVDGVITHPEQKEVTEDEILDKIIEKIQIGEPVTLNTGRSLSWLVKQVINPLKERIKEKKKDLKVLENFFAVGEKGNAWIIFAEDGQDQELFDETVSVPQFLQEEIKNLVQKQFSETMFYDEIKKTMISIEMKKEVLVLEFKAQQKKLNQELLEILQKYNLEEQFKIDPTRIATDIENKQVGKGLGAKKILEWLSKKRINAKQFITFGDSKSDLEMAEEIHKSGQTVKFVFVGEKEELDESNPPFPVIFTKNHCEQGTLEYLASHSPAKISLDSP